jgi:hypothetical protein
MRYLCLTFIFLFSFSLEAQRRSVPLPGNPPPPVPLDGGLMALIGAGAALGYKKYKAKNQE